MTFTVINLKSACRIVCFGILILLTLPQDISAQFFYVSGGAQLSRTQFSEGQRFDPFESKTLLKSTDFNLEAHFRPLRNLSVGLGVNIPVSQKNSFTFSGSRTGGNDNFYDFESSIYPEFRPSNIDYELTQTLSYYLFTKVFIDTKLNVFIEGQIGSYGLEEEFVLRRAANPANPQVSGFNENVSTTHTAVVPGLGVGFMPHLGDKFFIQYKYSVQFLSFDDPSFAIRYDYDWIYPNEYRNTTLNGQVADSKTKSNHLFSIGAFF